MNLQQTTFIQSAATLSQLPKDNGIEVAFIGRSNSGKSSAINTITGAGFSFNHGRASSYAAVRFNTSPLGKRN